MSRTSFDQIVEGIDRHLSYLHKERWTHQYAGLMDAVRTTTGEDQERARQALRDHHRTEFHPQTSRAALIEQARFSYDASKTGSGSP